MLKDKSKKNKLEDFDIMQNSVIVFIFDIYNH